MSAHNTGIANVFCHEQKTCMERLDLNYFLQHFDLYKEIQVRYPASTLFFRLFGEWRGRWKKGKSAMDDGMEKSVLFNETDVIAFDHDIDIPG